MEFCNSYFTCYVFVLVTIRPNKKYVVVPKKIRVGRLGSFFCELFLYTHIKFPQVAELASAGMEAYMYNSIL